MPIPDNFKRVGEPGLVQELFPGERWSPNTGAILTEIFSGTEEEVQAEAAACRAAGLSYTIHAGMEGGHRKIEVSKPTAETGFTLYLRDDLIGRDQEKDLIQDPSLHAAPDKAVLLVKGFMDDLDRTQNQNARESQFDLHRFLLATATPGWSLPSGTLVNPYVLHARGVRSTPTPDWVIRRTAVYAPGAPMQPQFFTNVRCVYETSMDLAVKEGIDPNRIWDIPAGEWFKRSPTFTRQTNGTTVVTVEWWWALEWANIYPRAAL